MSFSDSMRIIGRSVKDSTLGSHGAGEWLKPLAKNPLKHAWSGFWNQPLLFKAMNAHGLYQTATDPYAGPTEKVLRTAGVFLGNALGSKHLDHSKSPGFIGGEIVSNTLGGGMLMNKGILGNIGETIDNKIFRKNYRD